MNRQLALTALCILFVSCGFSRPTATVKSLDEAYAKGDFDKVVTFYTAAYIKNGGGAERLKQQLKDAYDIEKANGKGQLKKSFDLKERITGNKADVCGRWGYQPPKGEPFLVHLVREDGRWKMDGSGSEKEAEECLK